MLREFVEHLVTQLVNDPESVVVSVVHDQDNVDEVSAIEIRVNSRDRGRLIGKRGQTIRAIRTLVDTMVSSKEKISVRVAD